MMIVRRIVLRLELCTFQISPVLLYTVFAVIMCHCLLSLHMTMFLFSLSSGLKCDLVVVVMMVVVVSMAVAMSVAMPMSVVQMWIMFFVRRMLMITLTTIG